MSDSGAGIDPSFLPHIFNRFSQEVRGETRKHGGLGLGLAIVRHVVEAHGGTVRAESEGRGKGTTFTVLLPLSKISQAPASPHARDDLVAFATPSLDRTRVLVVEDDSDTREALTEMLTLAGADVRSAASAQHAISTLEEFAPELLVCDIAMPEEDGYSLIRRIRALGSERGGDVPALALTALASSEDRRKAIEAGFQLHLAKPVDIRRLISALTDLQRRRPSGHPKPSPR